jgi:hypothetical protein
VTVDGTAPTAYKTSVERTFSGRTLVVWIGQTVKDDAEIRIGGMK